MKHTPGPWKVDIDNELHTIIRHNTGTAIAQLYAGSHEVGGFKRQHHITFEEKEANAHRIVNCVNACEGLTDDQLKYVKEAPAMLEVIKKYRNDVPEGENSHIWKQHLDGLFDNIINRIEGKD
jgi:hypothetical protein